MPQCKTCKFWQPRYFGVGRCAREGFCHAKHWVADNKDLLTVASFGCVEHEPQPDPKEETL